MTDDVDDESQTPTREQLRSLLERYFAGPVDDALVTRLIAEVDSLFGDPEAEVEARRALLANHRSYCGQAWREELSPFGRSPRRIELVAHLVARHDGGPAPHPYCPEPLVGIWDVIEPSPSRWTLSASGDFRADDDDLREQVRWCVFRHEHEHDGGLVGDSLRLDGYGQLRLTIHALSSTELRLRRIQGYEDAILYHLKRLS